MRSAYLSGRSSHDFFFECSEVSKDLQKIRAFDIPRFFFKKKKSLYVWVPHLGFLCIASRTQLPASEVIRIFSIASRYFWGLMKITCGFNKRFTFSIDHDPIWQRGIPRAWLYEILVNMFVKGCLRTQVGTWLRKNLKRKIYLLFDNALPNTLCENIRLAQRGNFEFLKMIPSVSS